MKIISNLITKLLKLNTEKDMVLPKNPKNSKSSNLTGIWSEIIINPMLLLLWPKTNSWILLSNNSKLYIWVFKVWMLLKRDIFWATNLKLTLLIGLLKEPLLQLKTKVNVDHVGLSLLLDLSKVLTLSKPENSNLIQNNIWLTALKTVIMVVMVVWWITLSNM